MVMLSGQQAERDNYRKYAHIKLHLKGRILSIAES